MKIMKITVKEQENKIWCIIHYFQRINATMSKEIEAISL